MVTRNTTNLRRHLGLLRIVARIAKPGKTRSMNWGFVGTPGVGMCVYYMQRHEHRQTRVNKHIHSRATHIDTHVYHSKHKHSCEYMCIFPVRPTHS